MSENPVESASAIEDVVAELHRRGVERGEREYERRVAEAQKEAAEIIAAARSESAHLVEEGRREAARLVDMANAEAEQLLHAFSASLAEIFDRRAAAVLEAIGRRSFSEARGAETLRRFVDTIDGAKIEQLQGFLERADPQTFLEALLILAIVFYADIEGFDTFQIDADLQGRLAQMLADTDLEPGIQFEFRQGIAGFRVANAGGYEVEVSEESLRHMAATWVGDEFREVLNRILAKESIPGAARDG